MNPQFNFDTNENSIVLHTGSTSICIEDTTYVGEGEAKLELLPKASIVFNGEFKNVDPSHIFSENLSQSKIESFSFDQHKIEGFNIGGHSDIPTWRTKWMAKSEPVKLNLQPNEETKKIIFHLFNFVDFSGADSSIKTEGSSRTRIHHITLSWNLYKIKIESLLSTKENIKILENEGGYRLTQVGSIEKSDGSSFSDDEQKDLLEGLRYFISFAKGSWCSPICPVGLSSSAEKIWYSLNSPDKQWQSHSSWFDSQHASDLEELFPLFMDTWEKENWKSTIKEILYWYLNANDPGRGVDAGLILSQAALERLSFEYVVNEKKMLSSKGFKDLWASDKFRLLFSSLDIPIEIPSMLPSLIKSTKSYNWIDTAHALTEIRNALIHPDHKKHGQISTDLFIESWNLSLWYLEMAILAICGHTGTYANRLMTQRWVGSVENVPWRKEELDNDNVIAL